MVESQKVFARDLTSTTGKDDAVPLGDLSGPAIRALAGMPMTGPGGINREAVGDAALVQFVQESAFGQGAAADIPHAHEKDAGSGRCTHLRQTLVRRWILF